MTTSYINRLGTSPEESIKAPCVASTPANITLSGEQTIDGVAVVSGDRVLVRSQTDTTENGIYDCSTSAWTRSTDWNDSTDVINGMLVPDANATNDVIYKAEFTGDYNPGVTLLTFAETVSSGLNTYTGSAGIQAEYDARGQYDVKYMDDLIGVDLTSFVVGEEVLCAAINVGSPGTYSTWQKVSDNQAAPDVATGVNTDGFWYSATTGATKFKRVRQTQIDNVAALKLYEGEFDGQQLPMRGYYAGIEGGGQTVQWDATSTETANDGTIFQATGVTTGRWKSVSDISELLVDHFGAYSNGTNSVITSTAINTYIDSLSGGSKIVHFGIGTYNTGATIGPPAEMFDLTLKGQGLLLTKIVGDHLSGAVVKGNRSNFKIIDMQINATASRTAGAAGSNYGIYIEAEDTSGKSIANCLLQRAAVYNQPNHGILMVGNCQLSELDQVLAQNNKGHGFCFDEGVETGRVNVSSPGLVTMTNCWSVTNDGHALCAGNPADTGGTGAFRFHVINFETVDCAQAAGTRHTDDQVYIRGQNNTFLTSALAGKNLTGGFYVAGRDNYFINNRFIECNQSYTIGVDPVSNITQGIVIDGFRVLNTAQNPAIVVEDTTKTRQLDAKTYSQGNITNLITSGVPVSAANNTGPVINNIYKSSAQSVNNTTTLANDSELKYPLDANETVSFRAAIRFSGDASADIKVAFTGPSGVNIRWSVSGSTTINTADAVTVVGEKTESGTYSLGTSATVRWIEFVGRINNGATAGDLQFQFAQSTAVVANTTVQDGSWIQIMRETN